MDDLPAGVIELLSITGNDTCMECDSSKVEWASINLGIFLCESCGGRHRHLGVHISRIQSLKLDTTIWKNSQIIQDMKLKGNINAKYYFESRVPLYQVKPPLDIGPVVIEDWIRNKYEKHLFIDPNVANNIYSSSHMEESKSNPLDFALHKMPCSPVYSIVKYIVPTTDKDKNEKENIKLKQQFIILHGRFLSRYNSPSSQKCEQIIDITLYKIYISVSELDRPCILSLQNFTNGNADGIRFQFEYYKDVKYWTELLRKSSLFYCNAELGLNLFALQPNDTVNSLLQCSIIDLDNTNVYKHLKYGSLKKQSKFSIGWDKKWWAINLRRKILIYFSKDPHLIKRNKKNPMFIEAQNGFYMNEIIGDIDNNGFRSGQSHCLLLYHFNKTIFIKFEDRWPLIQFWKELHLKGKDVKYIGNKAIYYEKALCQENVDVQVMVALNKRNSTIKTSENKKKALKTIKITMTEEETDDLNLHMNSMTVSDNFSVGSPPIPPSYDGSNTINGMGIGTAILNHEMLMNHGIKMTINDHFKKHKPDENINPISTKKHQKISSLRMLMDLHNKESIQNDVNLSDESNSNSDDDDEPYDFDDVKKRKKNSSIDILYNNNKRKKKMSNLSDSFNDDFGIFDYENNDNDENQYKKSSPLKHLINENRKSPIDIKQSVSVTVSDNDNENDEKKDINEHIIGRMRNAVGSMEELQFLADNTPLLPQDENNYNSEEEEQEETYSMINSLHIQQTSTNNLSTITDPPSDMQLIKQFTNSDLYNTNNTSIIEIEPQLSSNFSDGNLSEEEDIMYKDHRRGTVEQYAEKNKYKSRTYRNFAKNNDSKPRKSKEESKSNNNESKNISKVKLPAPPPKRKKQKGNELLRQYHLNAMQLRKLNDADMMQQIMIQVGSMASFFVQPGNKLYVHLHGVNEVAQTVNETHNTQQMWEYVEELLSERIGVLQLIQQH